MKPNLDLISDFDKNSINVNLLRNLANLTLKVVKRIEKIEKNWLTERLKK